MSGARVGVVMLVHDRADVAVPCLRSLAAARGETPWEIYLLDNGSAPEEAAAVEAEFRRLSDAGAMRGRYVRSEVNHGFPRGNNLGIREFLERDEVTHLCLVNSDVLVPDGWLDLLTERCVDAVGPVTNACGNEQTVPFSAELENDGRALDAVNARARERLETYRGLLLPTRFLGFFCFLARIELFLAVGLLDEGFGRGAFEDDDYCLRIRERGFRMEVARDVYVHHWGSASFSRVPTRALSGALARNKRRFERKHGVVWESRRLLPIAGAWQDAVHLSSGLPEAPRAAVADLAASAEESLAALASGCEPKSADGRVLPMLASLRRWVLRTLGGGRAARVLDLARTLLTRRTTLVLGRWYPTEADLSDGYFQRVLAIDRALRGTGRIYVRTEGAESRRVLPRLNPVAADAYEVWIRPRNPVQAAIAAALALWCGRVYVHSILRLHGRFTRLIYALCRRRLFDVHGVVPEEFAYEGDEQHSREFGALEARAIRRATVVVVVGRAMEEHLRSKYGERLPPTIVLPNVPKSGRWEREDPPSRVRDGIVYAGGLHKWQQIDAMLDYAHQVGDLARFTFLVTRPDELRAKHRERHGGELAATVTRVPVDEVAEWYRRHAFGLALREDVIVNRAACPTKLVEYLQQGLVPIVDSPRIGDFERLGYRSVPLGAPLPDSGTLAEMRRANQAVVRELHREHLLGAEAVLAALR